LPGQNRHALCRRIKGAHYQELFAEIGMKTISAGYEFAHRDDYEGRKVIPNIVVDADTRNIEELTVEADPERYRPRKNR